MQRVISPVKALLSFYRRPGAFVSFTLLLLTVAAWYVIDRTEKFEYWYSLDEIILVLGIAVSSLLFITTSLWVTLRKELMEVKWANTALLEHQSLLQASQQRSQQLFETNPHAMWFYDLETLRFLDVNEAAIRRYGYSRQEFLEMTVLDIRPEDEKKKFLDTYLEVTPLNEKAGHWRHLRKDGTIILAGISTYRHVVGGRVVELVLANDETAKVQAEEALRQSEASFRSFVNYAPYGIFRSDLIEDRFLEVNPVLVKMLGYDSSEQLHAIRLSADLYCDPDDRNKLIGLLHRHGIIESEEVSFRQKDGTRIQVRLSGRLCSDPLGVPCLFEGFMEDVTEKRRLEEQLRQSQKMEAVGRLAGGIAHDFNNMLTAVIGYSDMLAISQGLTDKQQKHVSQLAKAAQRAAALTKQLLAFSRQQVLQPKLIDANDVIEETLQLVSRLLGDHIVVRFERQPDPALVFADVSQMAQILMNLCLNARDAMPCGGTLSVSSETIVPDERTAMLHPGMQAIPYVRISLADTGEGMTPEVRARIFEPFFTTKGLGKGTGLGLATVHGLVAQSRGFVSVESEVGRGSCFRVFLPACGNEVAPALLEMDDPASTATSA